MGDQGRIHNFPLGGGNILFQGNDVSKRDTLTWVLTDYRSEHPGRRGDGYIIKKVKPVSHCMRRCLKVGAFLFIHFYFVPRRSDSPRFAAIRRDSPRLAATRRDSPRLAAILRIDAQCTREDQAVILSGAW